MISLTNFCSKIFESFIAEWLLKIVLGKLDPGQFGGLKGNGITHYLIHFINFILANLDSRDSTAVLASIIDFSKAFNRMSHNRLIIIMHELNIPGWLLRLTSSYLSNRKLIVRYKGSTSSQREMPGGAPQGTVLGVLAFIFQMNEAGVLPSTPNSQVITQMGTKLQNTACKFIDDLSALAAIKLRLNIQKSSSLDRPLKYHGRTGHVF